MVQDTDRDIIAWQLGREPHRGTAVAVRCRFGRPVVIETPPRVAGDQPNPTLFYLTCPALVATVSRVEAQGGVRRLRELVEQDKELELRLEALTRLYRKRRGSLGADPRPEAGIGGPRRPNLASCLHAYVAALLAVESGYLTGPELSSEAASSIRVALLKPMVEDSRPDGLGDDRSPKGDWCGDDRCAAALTSTVGRTLAGPVRRAAIDVGTISVRLLVADVLPDGLRTLVRHTEVTRLGKQLRPGARLHPVSRERTAEAVLRLAGQARGLGAEVTWLVGTSAAREASDGRSFIDRLGREAQAVSKVLSGQEEAALAYAGVRIDVPGCPLVVDIGGGSTELMAGSEQDPDRVVAVSLRLGASRATDSWIHSDPPAPEEVTALYHEAKHLFAPLREQFSHVAGPLVGVAGTVTTLACLDAGLEAYDGKAIHLRLLTQESVREWVTRLSRLRAAQVAALSCVQAGRAPVLVAGAVILQAALEVLGRKSIIVSERDLLDGLVMRGLSR